MMNKNQLKHIELLQKNKIKRVMIVYQNPDIKYSVVDDIPAHLPDSKIKGYGLEIKSPKKRQKHVSFPLKQY